MPIKLAKKIAKTAGLDRSVRWSLLVQGMRLLTGPVTMILMLKYLTPEMQGYAYAFSSVLAISIFLELGFSQNILQFASHEFSKLSLTADRKLSGDGVALSRLTSLARLSFKYYGIAAVLFVLVTIFGGAWFFRTSKDVGVAWELPWLMACVGSSLALVMNPCWALLEGCNQVAETVRLRFWISFVSFILTVIAYMSGCGLYVGPIVALASIAVSSCYFIIRWRGFFGNFLVKPTQGIISWKKEIWPFQWRIGVSWMSGYLLFSIVVPIIFRKVGPVDAGKYGFTMALVTAVANTAGSWSTTKLPQFGMLVAQEDWLGLKTLWRQSTMHTLLFAILGSIVMISAFAVLSPIFPMLEDRYTGPLVASMLCVCMVAQNFINSCAYLLRAFKKEPYMWPSVIGAVINATLIWIFTSHWGIVGSATAVFLCNLIMFYPTYSIFRRKQLQFMNGVNLMSRVR
jgi:O-antigen/teichoic acid export membrane protein